MREPVWAWLRQDCPSFTDSSANAVFSDIFRLNTMGPMNMELKSLFLVQQTNQSFCCTCTHLITNFSSVFVLYITSRDLIALVCTVIYAYSGNIFTLQHFVTMPIFLTIELSSDCINDIGSSRFLVLVERIGSMFWSSFHCRHKWWPLLVIH